VQLRTYLNYGGNCRQAFRFYEQHLGGEITMMTTHGQMPDASAVAPEQKDAILHARISIGDGEIFGSDVPPVGQASACQPSPESQVIQSDAARALL